jgi:hypothetical protein
MADRSRSLTAIPPAAPPAPRGLPPTYQLVLAAGVIVAILAALVVVAIFSLLSLREDQVQLQDRNVPLRSTRRAWRTTSAVT